MAKNFGFDFRLWPSGFPSIVWHSFAPLLVLGFACLCQPLHARAWLPLRCTCLARQCTARLPLQCSPMPHTTRPGTTLLPVRCHTDHRTPQLCCPCGARQLAPIDCSAQHNESAPACPCPPVGATV